MKHKVSHAIPLRVLGALFVLALTGCGGWSERSTPYICSVINERFEIPVEESQILHVPRGFRGIYLVKLQLTEAMNTAIVSHPNIGIDSMVTVKREDKGVDWWDLNGKELRRISIRTTEHDGALLWLDEENMIAYVKLILREA